jgi:hypothetical protein
MGKMRDSDSLIGQYLGKYQIKAELGRGGMGVVYRGYDPLLDRPVAIKVLPPQLTYDGQFVQRFHQEAVLAARLHHPGIVPIYDVGEQNGIHYIVMLFLEGMTLEGWLQRQGPLAPAQARPILRQVADALDYAHSHGVIHRDIKPANVMLSPEGHATLMDFGLVRAAEGTSLTRTGMVMGTPEYMSPEQALGEEVDGRSDIYSLGIVLYKMLSGKVPFARTTPYAITYAHINEPPPPLRQVRADLPAGVEAVVNKALAKRREDRYARAGLMGDDFDAAVAGRPVAAGAALRAAPIATASAATRMMVGGAKAPPTGAGAPKWLPWTAGILLLILVAIIILLTTRPTSTSQAGVAALTPTAGAPVSTPMPAGAQSIAVDGTQTQGPADGLAAPGPTATLAGSSPVPPATATQVPDKPTAAPTRRPAPTRSPACREWHKKPGAGFGIVLIENHLGEPLSLDYAVGGSGNWAVPAKSGDTPGRWWSEVPVGTHVFNYTTPSFNGKVTFHVEEGKSYVSPLYLNDRSEDYVYPMEIPAGCR